MGRFAASVRVVASLSLFGIIALSSACGAKNHNTATTRTSSNISEDQGKLGLVKVLDSYKKVRVLDAGSHYVTQEGIVVPKENLLPIPSGYNDDEAMGLLAQGKNGAIDESYLWDKMTIPYRIENKQGIDSRILRAFAQAIDMYHKSTPIRFVEITGTSNPEFYFTLKNETNSRILAAARAS